MIYKCQYCQPRPDLILKTGDYGRILVPQYLHIDPQDGGHLVVVPNRHVSNRLQLTKDESVEMWEFSVIAAKSLSRLLSIDWYNFQENGNWTVDNPNLCHLHMHIYGRDRQSKNNPFGETLILMPPEKRKHTPYSANQIEILRKFCNDR